MTDESTPKAISSDASRKEVRRSGRRLRQSACLIVATAIVAATVAGAVSYCAGTSEQPPGEKSKAEPATATTSVPTPTLSQPAIMLASAPVPATAERLQRETEQVATNLRQQYPNSVEALHVAAMMHAQFRQSAQAEQLWQKCIELSPKKEPYYVNLAAIAMDRGNSDLAVGALQQALNAGLSSRDILHHLGVALTNLGRCDEAVEVTKRALAEYPESASHWVVLGQAQLKLGKPADAEESLQKAIELGSGTAPVYAALANACAQQGKQDEAAKHRKTFTQLTSGEPLAAQDRFRVLTIAEARRTAVAILTEAASVHSSQSNTLEAERLLLRAIALDPSSLSSCRALVTVYRNAGMIAEERVVWRRLVEIQPNRYENYLALAEVNLQLEDVKSAEAALKLAIAVSPEVAEGFAALARLYVQIGNAPQARWFAQEAVRRRPSANAYLLLASTCRLLGHEADAQRAMEEAHKLGYCD